MARKRYRKKPLKARLIFLISVALLFTLGWLFLTYSVNPVIRTVSEEKVRQLATTAVNNATGEVVSEMGMDYAELLEVYKNEQGEIELIQVNSLLLNSVARKIVSQSQANISSMGEQGIAISIGTLSGMTFLTGRGRDINIKVFPVGAVSVTFQSEFTQAGINQTRHKITLFVSTGVSVIMPGLNRTVNIVTEVALCENIIIGKVPQFYLDSGASEKLLDLLP